jgi:signal transduction histidine kinase
VVTTALTRAVLLIRAGVGLIAATAGLFGGGGLEQALSLSAVMIVTAVLGLAVLARWPGVVDAPIAVLTADSAVVLLVLVLSHGGVSYFVAFAGSAALGGVLLGVAALPVWAAQTVQAVVVGIVVVRQDDLPASLVPLIRAAPGVGILAGVGALLASRVLTAQMRRSVRLVQEAHREAAAQERARLARELHDSVAKTLRGMSLAALALPESMRRQPALAEHLADVIARGADAANQEARQLIDGLRLDSPDVDLGLMLRRLCQVWSDETGIVATATVAPVEPSPQVRYELTRIVHEALTNVARHSDATRVSVVLTQRGERLVLTVRDNGQGFDVPTDVNTLQLDGHAGLVGMMERARLVGGELAVTSDPGRGTVVRVRMPR